MQSNPGADEGRRPTLIGGRWRIVRPLAEGGMSSVYVAEHRLTHRQAALKVLHDAHMESEDVVERFQREAGVASAIGHDGIVEIFDAGHDSDSRCLYIAMELLQGKSLRAYFDSFSRRPERVLRYIQQVLDPLAAAHRKGYVHRDLKPDNVFLAVMSDGYERVKLLDFGIARHPSLTGLTEYGTAMGTPWYMSPEHALSPSAATPAADVWSIGVMMYEALSKQRPFGGDTAHAVIVNICTEKHRPLIELVPGVSPELSKLIDRCLAKEPSQRPRNADELASLLDRLLCYDSLAPKRSVTLTHVTLARGPSARLSHSLPSAKPAPPSASSGRPLAIMLCWLGLLATWIGIALLGMWSIRGQPAIEVMGLGIMVIISAGYTAYGIIRAYRRGHRAVAGSPQPTARRAQVVLSLNPRAMEAAPSRGPAAAPVTILQFGDFTCARTRRLRTMLDDVLVRCEGHVRLVWKDRPQSANASALLCAEAAREVYLQLGSEGFWKMHRMLLTHRGPLRRRSVEKYARSLKVDLARLRRSLDNRTHRAAIGADQDLARSLGATATPCLFINGQPIQGSAPIEVVAQIVASELDRLGLAIVSGEREANASARVSATTGASRTTPPLGEG